MRLLLFILAFVPTLALAGPKTYPTVYLSINLRIRLTESDLLSADIPYKRLDCPSTRSCYVSLAACEAIALVRQTMTLTRGYAREAGVPINLYGDYRAQTYSTEAECLEVYRKPSEAKSPATQPTQTQTSPAETGKDSKE